MADNTTTLHVNENTPEEVAFKLLRIVASAEKKKIPGWVPGDDESDRKYILDLYAECIIAVKGNR